ncbi:uncharacterized protein HMPREF1541_09917 [Cyphellophora europaea CBS 101466]|uniref:Uncharacterized protein n=1 Tax=Cyphellophora europaea (strain CBS 101466) TaxID=1220924 RepID=W2S8J8_CYPE1|nr:uncharacterized protein HMPREF1541_09917 [Cyphellophora europaea CBS 101466]ETN45041.1 hypothetical protein HMPREF1541_09917 [Cyphellophora europaea CBS 101466]
MEPNAFPYGIRALPTRAATGHGPHRLCSNEVDVQSEVDQRPSIQEAPVSANTNHVAGQAR